VGVLCIDFGTSSVRASCFHNGVAIPLRIAPSSTIDNASIPSYIGVDKVTRSVYFGEAAFNRSLLDGRSFICERSPKSWLSYKGLGELKSEAFDCLPRLSRLHFLVSFLAYVTVRCVDAARESGIADISEVRLSRPVYADKYATTGEGVYRTLQRHMAFAMSHHGDLGELRAGDICFPSFVKWANELVVGTKDAYERSGDRGGTATQIVEEPFGASLHIFRDRRENSLSLTLVVDVGAGTVDFVTYNTTTPSSSAKSSRKYMWPAHDPVSIWSAGDFIDGVLLKVAKMRIDDSSDRRFREMTNEIRRWKERLFEDQFVDSPVGRIYRQEVVEDPLFKGFLERISQEVEQRMVDLQPYPLAMKAPERLDIVFCGGGSGIVEIQNAVFTAVKKKRPGLVLGPASDFLRVASGGLPDKYGIDASVARMAVALGGCTPVGLWPVLDKPSYGPKIVKPAVAEHGPDISPPVAVIATGGQKGEAGGDVVHTPGGAVDAVPSHDSLASRIRANFSAEKWRSERIRRNLAGALVIDAARISEPFKWSTDESLPNLSEQDVAELAKYLGEIYINSVLLADNFGVDLGQAVLNQLGERFADN
jgi:hypothetical protein